jgi:VanZ family protein
VSAHAALRAALRPFRRPALWLGIWYFGWFLCVLLSLIHPPQLGVDIPEGDKFGHVLAYALLAAWANWIFAGARAQWRAALALCALGLAMELAQGAFTSDRMMDGWDLLADTVGVFAGRWLGLRRPGLLQQLERVALPEK